MDLNELIYFIVHQSIMLIRKSFMDRQNSPTLVES